MLTTVYSVLGPSDLGVSSKDTESAESTVYKTLANEADQVISWSGQRALTLNPSQTPKMAQPSCLKHNETPIQQGLPRSKPLAQPEINGSRLSRRESAQAMAWRIDGEAPPRSSIGFTTERSFDVAFNMVQMSRCLSI